MLPIALAWLSGVGAALSVGVVWYTLELTPWWASAPFAVNGFLAVATAVHVTLLSPRRLADFRVTVSAIWALYYVLAPTVQAATENFLPYRTEDPVAGVGRAGWYAALGYAAIMAGMSSGLAHSLAKTMLRWRGAFVAQLSSSKYRWLYLAVGFGSLLLISPTWGAEEGRLAAASGRGYLRILPVFGGVAVAALVVWAHQRRKPASQVALAWVLLLANSYLTFHVMGSRGRAILPAIVAMLALYVAGTVNVSRVIAVVVACLAVGQVLGDLRLSMVRGDRPSAEVFSSMEAARRSILDFAARDLGVIDTFACAIEVFPSQHPYLHGKTFLAVATMPIPRALWPGKPMGGGPAITNAISPGKYDLSSRQATSYTPSLIGELYINFGPWGILFGCTLFGLVYRSLEDFALRLPRQGPQFLFYAVANVVFGLSVLTGEFATSLVLFVFWAGPVLLLSQVTVRTRRWRPQLPERSRPERRPGSSSRRG